MCSVAAAPLCQASQVHPARRARQTLLAYRHSRAQRGRSQRDARHRLKRARPRRRGQGPILQAFRLCFHQRVEDYLRTQGLSHPDLSFSYRGYFRIQGF